ncbi:hypothetical protein MAPG_05442 [Magnaporthiopsis poae ATCC 64411]|uniref:DUF1711 domain-containing protein n=1 Tax=Magnaporthiopsis poae (strain ATCC 64411 / 73-15) TaxID=644358 RepID=A0A0C4DZE4_MAGP6|nr:hypothetical protein MAPG_05442 [Magnaporthiopsis poae ATCC 64411]
MPPAATKNASSAKDRRKSDKAAAAPEPRFEPTRPGLVTLVVPPQRLRAIIDPSSVSSLTEETPAKDKDSPTMSSTLAAAPPSNPDAPSDSNPNTPNATGTPAPPSVMGPPTEGPKKKGVKRSAAMANGNGSDGPTAKVRGKPGPKKKARLDDGTLESGRASGIGAHKLGPKANQGAINAGLRALDRSGKPCRKWSKGGFTLKSFTGVVWTVPRWTAPARPQPGAESALPSPPQESATASAEGSGSNKENGVVAIPLGVNATNGSSNDNDKSKDDSSNGAVDVEMQSAPSVGTDSPVPVPVAAAS